MDNVGKDIRTVASGVVGESEEVYAVSLFITQQSSLSIRKGNL